MSVVVASTGPADAAAWTAAIAREVLPADEVIWVGEADPPPGAPVTRRLRVGRAGRGELYGEGLRAATHTHIAFTDSRTVLGEGWRRAAGRALAEHAVVGGPVLREPCRSLRSWAGFFVEYGPHAAPPYLSQRGDIAANNVAYQRSAIDSVVAPGAPVWKTAVHERLRARHVEPVVAVAMTVTSTKRYRWPDLTAARAAHGRLYGAQRGRTMAAPARVAAALRCVALPLVGYVRLGRAVARGDGLRGRFLVASPLVVLALAAWSGGEALGYLTRREARRDVD